MKAKIFLSFIIAFVMFLVVRNNASHIMSDDVLLDNVEALANGEISFDFCMYEPNICAYYENGFVIKGTLQYTGTV